MAPDHWRFPENQGRSVVAPRDLLGRSLFGRRTRNVFYFFVIRVHLPHSYSRPISLSRRPADCGLSSVYSQSRDSRVLLRASAPRGPLTQPRDAFLSGESEIFSSAEERLRIPCSPIYRSYFLVFCLGLWGFFLEAGLSFRLGSTVWWSIRGPDTFGLATSRHWDSGTKGRMCTRVWSAFCCLCFTVGKDRFLWKSSWECVRNVQEHWKIMFRKIYLVMFMNEARKTQRL